MVIPLYTSPINRPQSENDKTTAYLEVTQGCSHNLCRFCTLFKKVRYRAATEEELDKRFEYLTMCDRMTHYERVFLQAANPMHLSYDELMRIAERIHRECPGIKSIGGYGRVMDLADKSVEQLKNLVDMGFERWDFGIETADDEILADIRKGLTSADMREQLPKLNEAGFTWTANYMLGVGGTGRCEQSALKTAALFNEVKPTRIGVMSTTIMYDSRAGLETPLGRDARKDRYTPSGEMERLDEYILFLQNLDIEVVVDGMHATQPLAMRGTLPLHKQQMIDKIEDLKAHTSEEKLQRWRQRRVAAAF